MTKTQQIGLFGFGVVGQGLYEILQQNPQLPITVKKIGVKDQAKARTLPPDYFTFEADAILNDPEITLIAELTNDPKEGFEIVKKALQSGKKVVSANKKMIAQNLQALIDLQKEYNGTLLYEAAVCGSIPVLRTLEDYFKTEPLDGINGIFNGSSNYILSKIFNEQLDYATALKQAQDNGFAEADPALDVEGYDAKYKLVIAAAHGYGSVLEPDEVLNLGLNNLTSFDENQARQNGQKLKLLSRVVKSDQNQLQLFVMPEFVSPEDRLFSIDEEYNAVTIDAPYSGAQFLVGQGAGAFPTGSAVLADIRAALGGYHYTYRNPAEALPVTQDEVLEVYVGFSDKIDLEALPFQEVKSITEGLSRNAAIATIALKDLQAHQQTINEKGFFIASTGKPVGKQETLGAHDWVKESV